jgi:hypothetical protein
VSAAAQGASCIELETQNVNVAACRFYARQGYILEAIHRFAHLDLPNEAQLPWYERLRALSRGVEPFGSFSGLPRPWTAQPSRETAGNPLPAHPELPDGGAARLGYSSEGKPDRIHTAAAGLKRATLVRRKAA